MLEFKYKKLHKDAKAPQKNKGDVGWDIFCVEDKHFNKRFSQSEEKCLELQSGWRYTFKTGLRIDLPDGYHIKIEGRSGLAVERGIDVLAGVCDGSFTGEYRVCLQNTSSGTVVFYPGDKIAQMIVIKEQEGEFSETFEERNTERSDKGFGSTGR